MVFVRCTARTPNALKAPLAVSNVVPYQSSNQAKFCLNEPQTPYPSGDETCENDVGAGLRWTFFPGG